MNKIIFITARIRRMTGGYIFSLSTLWGGYPIQPWTGVYPIQPWMGGYPNQPWMGGVPDPALDRGYPNLGQRGYPIPCLGGYPNLGWGVPHPMSGGVPHLRGGGYPIPCPRGVPWVPPHQNSKHLLQLCGGRCASCVHAGGLSCSFYYGYPDVSVLKIWTLKWYI